jgi:hypothetical protein
MVHVIVYSCIALFNIWILGLVSLPPLSTHSALPPIPAPVFSTCDFPPNSPCDFPPTSLTLSSPLPLSPLGSVDHEVPFPLSEAPLFPPTSAMPTLADLTSSSSDYVLPVTLHDTPRLFLQKWLVAVNAYARTLEPSLDQYGALYLVCTDEVWADLTKNQVHPVHNIGPIAIRPRPDHPTPPPTDPQYLD